jgi:hypothetical protein
MKLLNAGKKSWIKVRKDGRFAIKQTDAPEEFIVVTSPIKLKLDKDMLVFLDAVPNAEIPFSYRILYSTARKFREDYVKDEFYKHINLLADKTLEFE